MLTWSLACFCFLLGSKSLAPDLDLVTGALRLSRERKTLARTSAILLELEETLLAGMVPESARWQAVRELPAPWGKLTATSLEQLRSSGSALLPTMKRLRALAEEHLASLGQAKAKAAQALAQALACAALVPIFGVVLYALLPSIPEHPYSWCAACALGIICSAIASTWMLSIAESARWGGLEAEQRPWILAAQCAGERFLALIRTGVPADLAWTQACEFLADDAPVLATEWGHSVWQGELPRKRRCETAEILVQLGGSIRKAVQVSLMEGRPCTERVETALQGFRLDLRAQMEKQLATLPARCLLPLFIWVAPALMGLLAFGLYLEWKAYL